MSPRALLALPVVVLAFAGCGTATLSSEKVAKGAEDALEEQVGRRPDVTCPQDVEATVQVTTL